MTTHSSNSPLTIDTFNTSYPHAPWGMRILAFLIDSLISGIPLAALSILLLLMIPWFMGYQPLPFLEGVPIVFFYITFGGFLISFIWFCIYSLARDGLGSGQSLGKLICGLMVINVEKNQPCNLIGSILRNLPGFATLLISILMVYCGFFLLLIEPIATFIHEKGRRLGDHWAKTQVIEKKLFHERT